MATYYVDSGAGVLEYSVKTWAVGDRMVPAQVDASTNHLIAKQWVWQCTTGGTSTAIPTWPASVTDDVTTVTNGGVVWTARAPDNWSDAMPGLYWLGADRTTLRLVAGDIVNVASSHSKVYSAIVNIYTPLAVTSGAYVTVQSVNKTSSVVEQGSVESTSSGAIKLCGAVHCIGHEIKQTVFNASMSFSDNSLGASDIVFDYGKLTCTPNHATSCPTVEGPRSSLTFRNTTISLGGSSLVGFRFVSFNALLTLENVSVIGVLTTSIFSVSAATGLNQIRCISSDLSNATNLFDTVSAQGGITARFSNCKIPANIGSVTSRYSTIELMACSSADQTYDYYHGSWFGVVQNNQSYYLTIGGSQIKNQDGSLVAYSLQAAPTANSAKSLPLYTPWVSKFISATGSKTISMKIAYDSATALKDTECWIEVEYYGDASSPLSTVEVSAPVVSGTKSRDILATGTNLTDTSEGWTGTFTNKKTATLSKTVTIAQQGYVRCRVAIAKQQTIYVDNVIWVA